MTTSDLTRIDAELATTLQRADRSRLRKVVSAACTEALARTGLRDPRTDNALEMLAAGRFKRRFLLKDVDVGVLQLELLELCEELSSASPEHQAAIAAGIDDEETFLSNSAEYSAAMALFDGLNAFESDPTEASLKSVYAAHFAIGDIAALRHIVGDALR